MVAGGNPAHTARAILCYQQQSWENRELVVVDYGSRDLTPLLEDIPADELLYLRNDKFEGNPVGLLKNLGIDAARGDYIIHWHESDWHHPDRIRRQMRLIEEGAAINWLSGTLLHLDHPEMVHHPYVDLPKSGYTASLMHVNDNMKRYPEKHRHPDRAFISTWEMSVARKVDPGASWLIVRGLGGGNRDRKRFLSGLRNSSSDIARLAWLRLRGRDRLEHPRFHLTSKARESFQLYLKESRALGLITAIS